MFNNLVREKVPYDKSITYNTNFVGELPNHLPDSPTPPSTNPFVSQTLKMSNAELATSYAALILADDGVDITVRTSFFPRKNN